MNLPTKELLAQHLHAIGLFELEKAARAGEFSDYESEHATPKVELVNRLNKIAKTTTNLTLAQNARSLAKAVMEGEYDDTREEADEWFKREGKDLLKGDKPV